MNFLHEGSGYDLDIFISSLNRHLGFIEETINEIKTAFGEEIITRQHYQDIMHPYTRIKDAVFNFANTYCRKRY